MCLDPRPDRPYRTTRPGRRLTSRASLLHAPVPARATAPVVRSSALWALEHLAGDDDLVARGWVVLSREA